MILTEDTHPYPFDLMADPRLNSIHLEMPRREEFRRARDLVLGSRGSETLAREEVLPFPNALERLVEPGAPAIRLWLIDRDYSYPLHVGVNTLGRSSENDIVVSDGFVSRRHCAIVVHANDRVELFDTASKNGTFINGHKLLGSTLLRQGDEIQMCGRQFVFVSQGDPFKRSEGNTIHN
jgi:hypothetical protein